jgi:transcriptional regulator of arginine metabolism
MCIVMPWRSLIPALLTSGSFATQGELVAALASEGHVVNQATVSRELANLGVRKVDGVYRMPLSPALAAPIHGFKLTASSCIAVLHTDPAFAMVVAQGIDDAGIDGVLGTVAGDDTVFVATSGKPASERLAAFLGLRAPAR